MAGLHSRNLTVPEPNEDECWGLGLADLPESCIAAVLCLTTPRDVARLACASRAFRSAASSDLVWEAMLPPHYCDVLAQASNAPPRTCSKKEVYDFLSNRVLLENGTQEYWVERATGGVCLSIGARALSVTWGSDERYWGWGPRQGSRFPEAAELKAVCWFEVRGEWRPFLPPGTYTLAWRLLLGEIATNDDYPLQRRFGGRNILSGWRSQPVKFSLTSTASTEPKTVYFWLAGEGSAYESDDEFAGLDISSEVVHGEWAEIEVGEFTVEKDNRSSVELQFSMTEIESGMWKSGLLLDCVLVRPSSV